MNVNPRLVASLFAALLAGLAAGVAAVVAGWGVFAGLLLYSATGSTTLVILCVAWPPAPRREVPETQPQRQPALA